ncbi:DUF2064 domain-containing protein [Streptomyces sp. NPDC005438]|uniref:TIGR04282 family arsenosugar biosynthesis glycosyltransferase n=1 Tax=Streptomyces sp. NPDC005438 TaxID=3156880 RepID=UPI0033B2F759
MNARMNAAMNAGMSASVPELTMLVLAKEPVPGRAKTRLTPPYTPGQAARLAEAALTDTLRTVARLPVSRRVLALSGEPGPWLPEGFEVFPQCDGGLDVRIAHAFTLCQGPTLLVGMDTPQLTARHLEPALGGDWHGRAWMGMAEDGGFWVLGLPEPGRAPELVPGVPMSSGVTGREQRRRLCRAGLRVGALPVLRDMDTARDADRIAEVASGEFAAVHATLRPVGA